MFPAQSYSLLHKGLAHLLLGLRFVFIHFSDAPVSGIFKVFIFYLLLACRNAMGFCMLVLQR